MCAADAAACIDPWGPCASQGSLWSASWPRNTSAVVHHVILCSCMHACIHGLSWRAACGRITAADPIPWVYRVIVLEDNDVLHLKSGGFAIYNTDAELSEAEVSS